MGGVHFLGPLSSKKFFRIPNSLCFNRFRASFNRKITRLTHSALLVLWLALVRGSAQPQAAIQGKLSHLESIF